MLKTKHIVWVTWTGPINEIITALNFLQISPCVAGQVGKTYQGGFRRDDAAKLRSYFKDKLDPMSQRTGVSDDHMKLKDFPSNVPVAYHNLPCAERARIEQGVIDYLKKFVPTNCISIEVTVDVKFLTEDNVMPVKIEPV